MNSTALWFILLCIVLIVGPFATLRAVSRYRNRNNGKPRPPPPEDDNDPDKPSGFW